GLLRPPAHRRLRRDPPRAQPGGRPVPLVARPGHRPVVQRRPQEHGGDPPWLELDVLLVEAPGHQLQAGVDYPPEFAFHGAPRGSGYTPARYHGTRTRFTSSTSDV